MFLNSIEFEKQLIFFGAPTLMKLKIANLYSIDMDCKEIDYWIYYYNQRFNQKDLCLCQLVRKNRKMIYIYQKQKLENLINHEQVKNILLFYQYDCSSLDKLFQSLQARLQNEEFPHEIGLFLGYPLYDVVSFIEGKQHLYIGYWKVYSHLKNSQKTFFKYKKCTNEFMRRWIQGMSLEQICQNI